MPYITISTTPRGYQISMDEIFSNITNPAFSLAPQPQIEEANETRTTFREVIPDALIQNVDFNGMITALENFNLKYQHLIETENKSSLYRSFKIPKRSGGLRQIDAPKDELMLALRELKFVLEKKCFASHHTAAFAYVKKRRPLIALKRHQANNSRWFLKLDFSNFFGNTSFEFLTNQLKTIFPYSEIMKTQRGAEALNEA